MTVSTYVIKLDDVIAPCRLLRASFVFVTGVERFLVTNECILHVLRHEVCIRVSVTVRY